MYTSPPRSPQIWLNKVCLGEKKPSAKEIVSSLMIFAEQYVNFTRDFYVSLIANDNSIKCLFLEDDLSYFTEEERYSQVRKYLLALDRKDVKRLKPLIQKVISTEALIEESKNCKNHIDCLSFLMSHAKDFMYFLIGISPERNEKLGTMYSIMAQNSSLYIYGLLLLMLPYFHRDDKFISEYDDDQLTDTITEIIDRILDTDYHWIEISKNVSPALFRDFFRDFDVEELIKLISAARSFECDETDPVYSASKFWAERYNLDKNEVTAFAKAVFCDQCIK